MWIEDGVQSVARMLDSWIGKHTSIIARGMGGSGPYGGWVANPAGDGPYFLQISNGNGTVDHAYVGFGRVNRVYGTLVLHNDGAIEVDGMVDGVLKDCSACPYKMTNGALVISYTFQSYSSSGD